MTPFHRPTGAVGPINRRTVLGMIAGAAATPLVAACDSSDSDPTTGLMGDPTGVAVAGGTVHLAFLGGGTYESLDPTIGTAPSDLARSSVVFDQLFCFIGGEAMPQLATSVDVEPDGSAFTLRLREGVTWHDGSTLTAQDVLFTFTRLADPNRPYPSELAYYLDLAKISTPDDASVLVPTLQPVGDPGTLLAGANLCVIKDGTTEFTVKTTLGTGPYKVTAFQAGNESRLVRAEGYWDGDAVADELVISSIDDPSARVNAAVGGQVDYASDVPYATAKGGVSSADVEVRAAAETLRTSYGFVLNMTRPLLADPDVRMALRLGVDRQALVDTVFLGYGGIGNDLFGYGAKYYDDKTPLEHDADRAKELLEQAGAIGKPFVIRSADYEVGLNDSSELFAEQLRELGLDASAELVSVNEYFDEAGLAKSDAVSFSLGPFSLTVTYTRSAAYPALAFPAPELQEAVATAQSATSETARAEAWQTAQDVMFDRGNWLTWGRGDGLSIARKDLVGIEYRESPKYPWLGKVGFTA